MLNCFLLYLLHFRMPIFRYSMDFETVAFFHVVYKHVLVKFMQFTVSAYTTLNKLNYFSSQNYVQRT